MLFLGDLLTGLSLAAAAAGVAFLQSVSMAALCSLVISRAFSKRSLATFLATCRHQVASVAWHDCECRLS